MGFFGRTPRQDPEPIAPEIEAVLHSRPEGSESLRKVLSKNLGAISQTMMSGEEFRMITRGRDWDEVGVLTTDRCFSVRKEKIEHGPFSWGEIEKVQLGKIPKNGGTYVVWLFTESFRLDYRDDDPAKWKQQISFEGRVEREVQTIAALVRELRGVE